MGGMMGAAINNGAYMKLPCKRVLGRERNGFRTREDALVLGLMGDMGGGAFF